jgi:hypothetical protein
MSQLDQVKSFDELPAALSVWPGLGQALGVSRATAYKMINEPGFPCLRVSQRKLIIPKDRLIKYLETKADQPL